MQDVNYPSICLSELKHLELCTYNEIKKQKCVIHVIICLNTIFTADKSLMTIERHGMAQIEF